MTSKIRNRIQVHYKIVSKRLYDPRFFLFVCLFLMGGFLWFYSLVGGEGQKRLTETRSSWGNAEWIRTKLGSQVELHCRILEES